MSLTRVRPLSDPEPSRPRRRVRGAAIALVAGMLLSGCGLTDPAFRPGAAAQVGSTTIGLEQVEEAGDSLCDLYESLVEAGVDRPVSRGWTREMGVLMLVLRELGDRLSVEHDVTPSEEFQQQQTGIREQFARAEVEPDIVERVVPIAASAQYFLDIVRQLGADAAEGDSPDAAYGAGIEVVQEWVDEHGLEVNPRFDDIEFVGGTELLERKRADLSVAVSDFAEQAQEYTSASQPDPSFAESLPESQRCG